MATVSPKDTNLMLSKLWRNLIINLEFVPSKTEIKACSDEKQILPSTDLH